MVKTPTYCPFSAFLDVLVNVVNILFYFSVMRRYLHPICHPGTLVHFEYCEKIILLAQS